MQSKSNALRVTAVGKSPEARLFRSWRVSFAAGLTNQCNRLFQVRDLQECVNLRLRIISVQPNAQ